MQQSVSTDSRPRSRGSFAAGWPAIGFAALVTAGAVYSFSPRPLPDYPPTQLQADQLLINGLARDGAGFVAGGAKGRILTAESARGPWTDAEVGETHGSPVTRIVAVDDGRMFAVGHNLMILRSTDGGGSWQNVHVDLDVPEPLLDIAKVPGGDRLVAVGGFGQYLESGDGGDTWTSRRIEAFNGSHLNDIVIGADGTLLIAAERGLLLRSRDGGQTWDPLELDYPGSMFGALSLGDGRWLAFGMRGNAFLSEDNGDSWQAVDTGISDSLFGGTQLADGRVVLVGAMHTILIATPGEWTFRRVIPSKQGTYSTVLEAPDGAVLVGGDPGAQLIDLATGERRNGGDDA
ncbi:YCF48-related protein [Algiphilus sp.]|uniref:WD40/YVTN/BNR-like repeat-containing protein n=1 Tax=Algiphilus sp. TaxID=1872431 RepID=UPI0025C1F982|nr:YCF48-related protein [Algiphilus sp.]MCK5769700.1 hypothetical protein [Algiphilus sp.]